MSACEMRGSKKWLWRFVLVGGLVMLEIIVGAFEECSFC